MKSFSAKVANRISRIAAFCALSFIVNHPVSTVAQLSGSYTIGGMSPDYATFQEEINSLQNAYPEPAKIFVIKSQGQLAGSLSMPGPTMRVDVSAYPPEIYFFQFVFRTKALVHKAVII
jgi:hypothetical protein